MNLRRTFHLLAMISVLAPCAFALTGLVRDLEGKPLEAVVVRSSSSRLTDTTDAAGAWSLSPAVGVGAMQRTGFRLEKGRVVAQLAGAERVVIDGFGANGKRWIHRELNLSAGRHEIPLPGLKTLRGGSTLRIRSSSGDAVLTAARSAEVADTLSFHKEGYDPVQRILSAAQDTVLTRMAPSLARPGVLTVNDLNATTSTISWVAVPQATGYIATLSGARGGSPRDTLLTTTGFLVTDMEPGRVLRVRIRAVSGERTSDSSTGTALVHRTSSAPTSNGKVVDSIAYETLPHRILVSVPSWKRILSLRVYNEATPFLDSTVAQGSVSPVGGVASVGIVLGTTKLPVTDTVDWFRVVIYDSLGDSASCRIRARSLALVAGWKIDSTKQSVLQDKGGKDLDLALKSQGVWTRLFNAALTHQAKGRIAYEVRVYLDSFPPATTYNKAEVVMGFYSGMRLAITSRGQLMAGGQRGTGGAWKWYGPRTADRAVPLKRWVTLTVGTDDAKGELYAWIDGVPQPMWSPVEVLGTDIRQGSGTFALGADAVDGQTFTGKIEWARVLAKFPYPPGAAPGVDATIDD